MNLIERLGGYEESKKILYGYKNFGWKTQAVEMHFGFGFTIKDLDVALLEHRRQHNIFEIGDYYVYLYEWDSDLDIVCKFNPSEWNDHLWNIRNMIRHATDAEIKAGRRL